MKPKRKRNAPPPGLPDPQEKDRIRRESRTGMLRLVARREQNLLSLIEFGHELTLSLDFYGTADVTLEHLMNQMGTSAAAIWILPPDSNKGPILLRSHGMRRQWARAIGTACGSRITDVGFDQDMPMLVSELEESLGAAGTRLSEECGIALYAPIRARHRLFGFIALGFRDSGEPYSYFDLQVLSASLGMLGVSFENNGLYNRLLENHRQLVTANENLKELDRLKSEFLRNINHELRTPLTVMMGYLTFLLEREEEDPQKLEFLQTIHDESVKLKGLLEKLLDFSAMSEDGLGLQIETGDLEELAVIFHRERLPGVAESLHEFTIEVGGRVPLARYDPQRVRQILDALVDNAIKFTPQGSNLVLRIDGIVAGEKKWARIRLEDDGPGIPPERLPHVFDSFRQGDGSETRAVGGMGMGLAYAKQLAESMDGRLLAESEPGKGASFSLILPLA